MGGNEIRKRGQRVMGREALLPVWWSGRAPLRNGF